MPVIQLKTADIRPRSVTTPRLLAALLAAVIGHNLPASATGKKRASLPTSAPKSTAGYDGAGTKNSTATPNKQSATSTMTARAANKKTTLRCHKVLSNYFRHSVYQMIYGIKPHYKAFRLVLRCK